MRRRQTCLQSLIILACLPFAMSAPDARSGEGALGESSEALNKLLSWGIKNSNLLELREGATSMQDGQPSSLLAGRIAELREIMQHIEAEPSDAQLMAEALAIIKNISSNTDEKRKALTALRYLVEPIDNANDFPGLGGMEALLEMVQSPKEVDLQADALHVLGTAASNNENLQLKALENRKLVPAICASMESHNKDLVGKALYALGQVIRNSNEGHEQFYLANGPEMLTEVLVRHESLPVLKKALNLLHDLADTENPVQGSKDLANKKLSKALLQLMTHPDYDVQERVLLTLIAFAKRHDTGDQLQRSGVLSATQEARRRYAAVSIHADEEYRDILKDYLLQLADLEDALQIRDHDRTEL